MSEMFKPIGERARWRVIYELMRAADTGVTITYEDMATPLGLDPVKDRHALQMAARKADLELQKVDKRAATAVRGTGYRIVQPDEILGLGERRNRKAGRQVVLGSLVSQAVDLNAVEPATRKALETLARGFAVQAEINRRVQHKQEKQDELINMLMTRVDRLERRDIEG
jgi:hypothetical protein